MPKNDLIDPLGDALSLVAQSVKDETSWQFPRIEHWMTCFETLNEALPFAALLEAGQRYLWWVSGDVAEALLRKFGRTMLVKRRIGETFGCKARTVEYRALAAVTFPIERRFPDVPTDLYKEALLWPNPTTRLLAALKDGDNAYKLRLLRAGNDGRLFGPPYWVQTRGSLNWAELDDITRYTVVIEEAGGARFADNDIPVAVSVAPLTEDARTCIVKGDTNDV